MAILADRDILRLITEKKLEISPFIRENVQPASIDLTLDAFIKRPKSKAKFSICDSKSERESQYEIVKDFKRYMLKPGELVLGQIFEKISMPNGYAGQVLNRHSFARLGLDVSMTSYVNPGYKGHLTLSLKNNGQNVLELIPFTRICQLIIFKESSDSIRDYAACTDAKYLDEKNSLVSLIQEDREIRDYLKSHNRTEENMASFLKSKIDGASEDVLKSLTKEQLTDMGL